MDQQLLVRNLTHHCVDAVCHCDWRLSIVNCEEATAMYFIYIVNIALSALVVAVGCVLIFHRMVVKGHRLWDYSRSGGCLRPKPVDTMLVLLTIYNILRLVSSLVLVLDVAPENIILRSFLFEIPWQFGYGSFALYLVGIAQTLAESHKAVSTGWLPSATVVDLLGSWFFLWPFVINNICSVLAGVYAEANLYVAEVFSRLLYGFWFLHDTSLSAAVLFAGYRLVRILNSHLVKFTKGSVRYQAVKTGIFKIKMLVGIIIICLLQFASFLLLYGILRDLIMTSTAGSVILSVIWTYLGPLTTVFVELAIIINPKIEKNAALVTSSSSGNNTKGSTADCIDGTPIQSTSFDNTEEDTAYMTDIKYQQMRYQQLYEKHVLGPNLSESRFSVDRQNDIREDMFYRKKNDDNADQTAPAIVSTPSITNEDDLILTAKLNEYQSQLDQVDEILATMHEVKNYEDSIADRLLKHDADTRTLTRSKNAPSKKRKDDKKIRKDQQATFQTEENAELKAIIQNLRGEINMAMTQRLPEAKLTRKGTQLFIDESLWYLQCQPELRGEQDVESNPVAKQADLNILKKLLNSLFAADHRGLGTDNELPKEAERKQLVAELGSKEEIPVFSEDVRAWIMHVAAAYLKLAPLSDYKFLIRHLLRCSGGIDWAIPLVQYTFIKEDHDRATFMEEYITVLRLLFDPLSADKSHPSCWTEEDYLLCLDQLSIVHVYDTILHDTLESGTRTAGDLDGLFTFSDKLNDVLDVGIQTFRTHQYSTAAKRLAQCSSRISQVLADHISDLDAKEQMQVQKRMDEFLLKVVDRYLETKEANVWHFLPALPYHSVSIRALWNITTHMLDIKNYEEAQDLQHTLESLPDISRLLAFLVENQTQGIFLLGCLSNIVVAIPTGADSISQGVESELSACLITIIAYTFFTIAFLDDNLRDVYHKDVRDSFSTICTSHPFTISLLLRWTTKHFDTINGMALYLFRSLPVNRWKILKSDLVMLHELLCQGTMGSVQVTFVRYILDHLNYDYEGGQGTSKSKTQPWHGRKLPFLPYEIHEELAFLLLDACQIHHPLPDAEKNEDLIKTVGAAVSSYLPVSAPPFLSPTTDSSGGIIKWSWKIALQLKLYDCEVSPRASDIEKSITNSFLRDILHGHTDPVASHGALLIYISFMLSPTSRYFLRFEAGSGWDKLLVILRRGQPESVVKVLAEIIPAFVFMHGDDFFNDNNLVNFLRQMVDLKNDPMLARAGTSITVNPPKDSLFATDNNGVAIMIGANIWHGVFIDSVNSDLATAGGFSYRDLILHSWFKTVFCKQDWMWNENYVAIMDFICKVAFCLHRHDLAREMLVKEHTLFIQSRQQSNSSIPSTSPSQSPQRNPLRLIKNMLPDAQYNSLLTGEWSLASLTTSNLFRSAGVEDNSLWFAFEILQMETTRDQDARLAFAKLLSKGPDLVETSVSSLLKTIPMDKPVDFLSPYRWMQHALVCSPNHPLTPLYFQSFFSLYFANVKIDDQLVFYGAMYFHKKQELIEKLRDRIAFLQTYHSQRQSDKKCNERQQRHSEILRQIYYSMWLWLDDENLLKPDLDPEGLPKHYSPDRLSQCRKTGILKDNEEKDWEGCRPWEVVSELWLDLVDYDKTIDAFKKFPWIGSEKFYIEPEMPPRPKARKISHVYPSQAVAPPAFIPKKPTHPLATPE
ncbi:hypothetical protein BX666DRAFT_2122144 [Dichotomocladium elegans]|nr:hypothetical protein BX666DRAFT_2122144 [Dichotomocladium elegans]